MTDKQIFPQGNNPKDPLKKTGPEAQLELTKLMGQVSTGFPNEAVIGAAINVLCNAIRQSYAHRAQAEARYDELFGRFKSILLGHYDGVTGKRKSIFPFHQTISPVHFNDQDKIRKV